MNYYIQGSPARAEEIKAAFEELGYDVTGFDMRNDNILFFTYKLQTGGKFLSTTNANLYTAEIIKTHPDYKELELSVKPKFKVGKWVVYNCASIWQVNGIDWNMPIPRYELINSDGGKLSVPFTSEYNLKEWAIEDAKDGDVLVDTLSGTRALTILFRSINEDDSISAYCGWNEYTFRVTIDGLGYGTLSSTQYVPATAEQRDILSQKMQEAGYQWDDKKKELRRIHDIAKFYAGMPVLVRDYKEEEWRYTAFSHISSGIDLNKFAAGCTYWIQCVPYNDDTKHLLGTTDMCDEQYINW